MFLVNAAGVWIASHGGEAGMRMPALSQPRSVPNKTKAKRYLSSPPLFLPCHTMQNMLCQNSVSAAIDTEKKEVTDLGIQKLYENKEGNMASEGVRFLKSIIQTSKNMSFNYGRH